MSDDVKKKFNIEKEDISIQMTVAALCVSAPAILMGIVMLFIIIADVIFKV